MSSRAGNRDLSSLGIWGTTAFTGGRKEAAIPKRPGGWAGWDEERNEEEKRRGNREEGGKEVKEDETEEKDIKEGEK